MGSEKTFPKKCKVKRENKLQMEKLCGIITVQYIKADLTKCFSFIGPVSHVYGVWCMVYGVW